MKYPTLTELNTSREMIDIFRGYNHNLRIGDGEFYDMKNLSSDDYPVLSPRRKRGIYATPSKPQGMIAKDALCYVDGADFVITGEQDIRVSMDLTIENVPKTLVSMGAYVVILPDKKYINVTKPSDNGSIEASITTEGEVLFSLSTVDGADYEDVTISSVEPSSPENGAMWFDWTSNTLKKYSSSSKEWVAIATTYIKIKGVGIGEKFAVHDAVTISGITVRQVKDLNANMVIWARGDDYIVVAGVFDGPFLTDEKPSQITPITVARKMPDMDFVIESSNRLWGCKYGTNADGAFVNEIYASKLGDFKNWNCFMGISTDSYAASLGTDGSFTGAVTYLGNPIFFKENCMHKVYGSYPSQYQTQTTACRGVQKGCEKSLAVVNEELFYKSRMGVCVYDGSLPSEISEQLGEARYYDAVSGVLGNKYYISMRDDRNQWHMFVYDTYKNMWHKEDDTQAYDFCNHGGELYYIDYHDKLIKTMRGTGVVDPEPVSWMAETGLIGTGSPDKKYVSRLDIRMSLDIDARVIVSAEYNSSGSWEHLFTVPGTTLDSFAIPVRPKRCDHLRLRFDGYGDAKIYSICKTIEQGSDA